ncbi:hypothetical protein TPA0907_27450 [Micromonospora humidisoli]|nr:hypothetical protein TPA0907_27450 [Micromonospora sp. AKA109]
MRRRRARAGRADSATAAGAGSGPAASSARPETPKFPWRSLTTKGTRTPTAIPHIGDAPARPPGARRNRPTSAQPDHQPGHNNSTTSPHISHMTQPDHQPARHTNPIRQPVQRRACHANRRVLRQVGGYHLPQPGG